MEGNEDLLEDPTQSVDQPVQGDKVPIEELKEGTVYNLTSPRFTGKAKLTDILVHSPTIRGYFFEDESGKAFAIFIGPRGPDPDYKPLTIYTLDKPENPQGGRKKRRTLKKKKSKRRKTSKLH